MVKTASLLVLVSFLGLSAAWADVPQEHDVVLTGDFALSYQHITSSAGDGSIDIFRVSPTLDWLAMRYLTIGVSLVYQHLSVPNEDGTDDFGIIPRVGFLGALGPNAFVWPRVGIGYLRGFTDLSNFATSSGSLSINRVQLQVDVLFCYSPAPHFFIGGGPIFHTDLSSSVSSDDSNVSIDAGKLTAFGVTTVVGGYF